MRRRDFPSYVGTPAADGSGWRVRVEPAQDFDAARGRALGGRRVPTLSIRWDWEFSARNRQELAAVLGGLRDMGVAFLWVGHGWNAGDLFEWLRDDGLVTGSYRALGFTGAGGWRITER